MSFVLRGGKPRTYRYDVDSMGGEYALEGTSGELIFRPQSGSGKLYWHKVDFDTDTNFVELNGDAYSGEFRLRAAVDKVWLVGPMEIEITVVTQA